MRNVLTIFLAGGLVAACSQPVDNGPQIAALEKRIADLEQGGVQIATLEKRTAILEQEAKTNSESLQTARISAARATAKLDLMGESIETKKLTVWSSTGKYYVSIKEYEEGINKGQLSVSVSGPDGRLTALRAADLSLYNSIQDRESHGGVTTLVPGGLAMVKDLNSGGTNVSMGYDATGDSFFRLSSNSGGQLTAAAKEDGVMVNARMSPNKFGPEVMLLADNEGSFVTLSRKRLNQSISEHLASQQIEIALLGDVPTVSVKEPEGKARVTIGVNRLTNTKTGTKTTTAPSVYVYGLDGKVVDSLPR